MAGKLQTSFDRLKESGATLNAILNNLGEGVLATDLSGNVMFVNLAARAMLRLGSEGPLAGPPGPWQDFDLPEAVARCAREKECLQVRVGNGEGYLQVKLEHLDKFDEHRGGVLVVIRELSEGRRLEASQQRFLANAAHELKTPITTIVGASELLLTGARSFSFGKIGNSPNDRASRVRFPHRRILSLSAQPLGRAGGSTAGRKGRSDHCCTDSVEMACRSRPGRFLSAKSSAAMELETPGR